MLPNARQELEVRVEDALEEAAQGEEGGIGSSSDLVYQDAQYFACYLTLFYSIPGGA
jgi:hypothetical protein